MARQTNAAALMLLLLGGCASTVAPPEIEIPQKILSCPEYVPPPQPPAAPRTTDALAGYANATIMAWNPTAAALVECDRRRAEAVELLQRALRER